MEYFSVLERKGILLHATTWMNSEDFVLGEIIQSQKDKNTIYEATRVVKLIETESRQWLPGAG